MPTNPLPIVCALMLSLATSTSSGGAESAPTPLTVLKQWDGKYPFDRVDGKEFWSTPGLREVLTNAIGTKEYVKLRNFSEHGPSVPIEVSGSYVIAGVCQQHNCHDERFDFIIDTKAGEAFVCRATTASRAKSVVLWSNARVKNVESTGECTLADEDGKHDAAYFKRVLDLIPAKLR